MPLDVTIALLQFVALALPAIGIYMTFAIETRIGNRKEFHLDKTSDDPALSSPLGHSYHTMRVAVLLLLAAGICYFIDLILHLTFGGVLPFFLGVGILLTVASLSLFGIAIAFQQVAIRDPLSVDRSLGILRGHTENAIVETIPNAINKLLRKESKTDEN